MLVYVQGSSVLTAVMWDARGAKGGLIRGVFVIHKGPDPFQYLTKRGLLGAVVGLRRVRCARRSHMNTAASQLMTTTSTKIIQV